MVHTGLSHEAQYEQTLLLDGSFATPWMELVPFKSCCLEEAAVGSIDMVSFEFHHELPSAFSLSSMFLEPFAQGLPFIKTAVSLPL